MVFRFLNSFDHHETIFQSNKVGYLAQDEILLDYSKKARVHDLKTNS